MAPNAQLGKKIWAGVPWQPTPGSAKSDRQGLMEKRGCGLCSSVRGSSYPRPPHHVREIRRSVFISICSGCRAEFPSDLLPQGGPTEEKGDLMQKQLEALSFLDKRKATKPKVVTDQVPSVSGAPLSSDQVIVPVQQQTSVTSPSKHPPAKATKRVAPVSRRARVRGALLQENDDDNS